MVRGGAAWAPCAHLPLPPVGYLNYSALCPFELRQAATNDAHWTRMTSCAIVMTWAF